MKPDRLLLTSILPAALWLHPVVFKCFLLVLRHTLGVWTISSIPSITSSPKHCLKQPLSTESRVASQSHCVSLNNIIVVIQEQKRSGKQFRLLLGLK